MTGKEKTYRQERAIHNLVKASNATLDGDYAVALVWVGVATVHIAQLAGESGRKKAYEMVQQLASPEGVREP